MPTSASFHALRLFPVFALVLLLTPTRNADAQFAIGGVYIDADGMLRHAARLDPDQRLDLLRSQSADGTVSSTAPGSLRKVSLRRLEQTVADLHTAGKPLSGDVRRLAGLTEIRHVFFYEDDVVLAGPADAWEQTPTGEDVGSRTGRAVLDIDDLVVALRAAFEEQPTAPFLGCSIEPTEAGVRNYAAWMKRIGRLNPSRMQPVLAGMEQAMGPQDVKLYGLPESSRFALKLVAADYRLKRIALGHDRSPVREVESYLDVAARRLRTAAAQPQHRWWFVGEYDALWHSPDRRAWELDGQAVRVDTAPTGGDDADDRKKAAPNARRFAESMTKHFPKMAAAVPVFSELQNLVGLSVAAEIVARHEREAAGDAHPAGWKPTHFLDDQACLIAKAEPPRQVPSLANYRFVRGRFWMFSVSGGVEINPRTMLGRKFTKPADEKRKLTETHAASRAPKDNDRWWWD